MTPLRTSKTTNVERSLMLAISLLVAWTGSMLGIGKDMEGWISTWPLLSKSACVILTLLKADSVHVSRSVSLSTT